MLQADLHLHIIPYCVDFRDQWFLFHLNYIDLCIVAIEDPVLHNLCQ